MVGSYDHGGVLETSKLSSELYNYSTFLPSMPIKIVEKDHTNTSINFAHMMCAQSAQTDQNPVRIGTGTTIIVVPDSRSYWWMSGNRKTNDTRNFIQRKQSGHVFWINAVNFAKVSFLTSALSKNEQNH